MQESKKGHFWPNIDGYVLPQDPDTIFAEGNQSHVPLLAGWNKWESVGNLYSKTDPPTAANLIKSIKQKYGSEADEALKYYPHATEAEVKQSTIDLASEFFTVYGTWKWLEMANKTGGSPVYRYLFTRTPPEPPGEMEDGIPVIKEGARHSAEIEYVFGALKWKKAPWQTVDFKISDAMMTYWSNFARSGDPNGPGLPHWPVYNSQDDYQIMVLGPHAHSRPATGQKRFEFLDSYIARFRQNQ